jgi:hypothetical protein
MKHNKRFVKIMNKKLRKEELKKELMLLIDKRKEFKNFINLNTVFTEDSEYNMSNYSGIENIKRFLTPFRISSNYKNEGIERIGSNKANVLFVNGICTSRGLVNYQKKYIEAAIGSEIEVLFNYSDGVFLDIYECMQDRTFNEDTLASRKTAEVIKEKLQYTDELFIIGYSQGGIITSSALRSILNDLSFDERKKINYITFASGSKNSQLEDIKSEHFINSNDPICHIGYLSNKDKYTGNVHVNENEGHLLIVDYLKPLLSGAFGKESICYKLFNNKNNQ